MTAERLPFIDWMKCLGMALIVFGHVGAAWFDSLTPPCYPKQLGVAFFLFVTGYSLARERRPWPAVLTRRLFEVYLYGISFALLMSGIDWVRISNLDESNYLPFLFGINVAMDSFPANPTTWYIGTYIHLLALWALTLRFLRPRPWMLIPVVLAEILIRGFLMERVGLFAAYMFVTNWTTVFLLGLIHGHRAPEAPPRATDLVLPLVLVGLLVVAWPRIAWPLLDPRGSFPFTRFTMGSTLANLGVTSAAVTLVYAAYTWSIHRITCRLPDWALVRFFARNTLFIFIAHMPVYYALQPLLGSWIGKNLTSPFILFFVCFVGLALVSEALDRVLRPTVLRDHFLASGWLKFLQHAQAG
jgi:fucose 4-O-acetylase-like acetyltransferase